MDSAPWRYRTYKLGGLWAVGFGDGSDLLLVVSASGRGVLDCLTGQRVARDLDEGDYDENAETIRGIGPLADELVPVCGTHGAFETRRRLPLASLDQWTLRVIERDALRIIGRDDALRVAEREGAMRDNERDDGDERVILQAPECDEPAAIVDVEQVRAVGFSPTGRSAIVAEPHTLHVWWR